MTISATPFSGCDCCGYGFEMFESPANPYWYLGSTITSPGNALQIINKSDGTRLTPKFFTAANLLVAVDDQNNFYYLVESSTTNDTLHQIRKYDVDGNELWNYTPNYNAYVSSGFHQLGGLAVDVNRNVYVSYSRTYSTGFASQQAREVVVEKINSVGAQVWETSYRAQDNFPIPTYRIHDLNSPVDLNLSQSLNRIHVTGTNRIRPNDSGVVLRNTYFEWQLDLDGNQQWVAHESQLHTDTNTVSEAVGNKVVLDSLGNAVIAYNIAGPSGRDYSLVSYDSAGVFRYGYEQGSFVGTGSPLTMPLFHDIEMRQDRLFFAYTKNVSPATPANRLMWGRLSGIDLDVIDWETEVDSHSGSFSPVSFTPSIRVDSQNNVYGSYIKSGLAQFYAKLNSSGSLVYQDDTGAATSTCGVPMIPPGRPSIFI